MSEILIICGMMGVGKTTLAKKMGELGYIYIDFDDLYHNKVQVDVSQNNFGSFLKELINIIETDKHYVIDGWFSWHSCWWSDAKDMTLNILGEIFLHHQISLITLTKKRIQTINQYKKKHPTENLSCYEEYIASYIPRQNNLLAKVNEYGQS